MLFEVDGFGEAEVLEWERVSVFEEGVDGEDFVLS
jgi:hypothetical protein